MNPQQGQASPVVKVNHSDLGGCVRFTPTAESLRHPDLGAFLALSVTQWFLERSHLRLSSVLPVVKEGNTVEMLAWYEQHGFPDTSGRLIQNNAL